MAAGALERLNSSINNSATMVGTAAADIPGPAHRFVMYDADGNIAIATSAEAAIGTILSSTLDPIFAGRPIHFLIKYIGLVEAGAAIDIGALCTIDTDGRVIPAEEGDFIVGRAFEAATVMGDVVQFQINQMGYMA